MPTNQAELRDKSKGLDLPTPVTPETSICYLISVPNAPEYRRAFKGALFALTDWFYWKGVIGDEASRAKQEEAAALWLDRISDATWGDCGGGDVPLTCIEIAECIGENPDVLNYLVQRIVNTEQFNNTLYQNISLPPPPPFRDQGGIISGDCDPDKIYSQVVALVDTLHQMSLDLFELIAQGVNAAQRAEKLISAIPAVGMLPVDEIAGMAVVLVEDMQQEYMAEYTAVLSDEIKCAIFCLAKDSCQLELGTAAAFYSGRAGATLPSTPLEIVQALSQYLVTGNFDTDIVVYASHLIGLAMMRAGQDVMGTDFTRLLLRVSAAADEANNDWQTLCEECPPGGLVIYTAASPNASVIFVRSNADGTETYRVFTQILPNTYWYASVVPSLYPDYEIVAVRLIQGGFYDWSSNPFTGAETLEGIVGWRGTTLDFYGQPGDQAILEYDVKFLP